MSLSNSVDITNPSEKFFKWSGSKGIFEYYDKEAKINVDVKLPFKFIVLDTLSTIKGFSDANQSGFWSNEVRELDKESLTVYTKINKKDIKKMVTGLYNDIKGNKDIIGSKYCQSVYIALSVNGVMTMCNIQLTGAALSAWIDFCKVNKSIKGVEVNSSLEGKKGATTYKIPVFNGIDITEEQFKKAVELDVVLQQYLKLYFKKKEEVAAE